MTLGKLTFTPLTLGQIKPTGWLRQQLKIQANGLSGALDQFWPDIKDSSWFGGQAEGWERAPYWLDGVIPLAHLLDDEALLKRIKTYMDYIIANQGEDGWLGPREANVENIEATDEYDPWGLILALKVLVQYHQITQDEKVLNALQCCLKMMDRHMDETPLFNWSKYRWFESLISIYYVYEIQQEEWLIDLARKFFAQGFDWKEFFKSDEVRTPNARRGDWSFDKHVVNNAMAIKANALWWRVSGEQSDRSFGPEMIAILDRFHGMVTGVFTGDECLSGKNPIQGTELCAVVEYMFSLEQMQTIVAEPAIGDRLEKIAFNALPATFGPDMWTHQYDQQVNQVQATDNKEHMWTTNGDASNTFGLEPHFGCCTSNMHQGWPKFAASLIMKTDDDGLAIIAYAPCEAKIIIDNTPVKIEVITEYPFRDSLLFKITSEQALTFPLKLRIPQWASRASIQLDNEEILPEAGTYYSILREWSGETELKLTLPMLARSSRRYRNALSIERGPLVYALKIEEHWKQYNKDLPYREAPHSDYEVLPISPWQYALDIDEQRLNESLDFVEHSIGDCPFSPEGAPVSTSLMAMPIKWNLQHGWAGNTPISPVEKSRIKSSIPERVTLIPYGCTNLRITEFPTL
ncbi:glycoside hydrolase family 127 protein [Lentisphaera marina]|uniref:beta-L-arabinofuranosidase domain-containing protein n=1 Tax=Lentisphaera marina TaxID=1111041 RepID=UPI002365CAB3|nr:beta-L-arabinofuranosidase domain-containing protein [Lentisphaera marina]MDD7987277.1 glycoside hydrolase family 127 protein [Lentisphaera marina]